MLPTFPVQNVATTYKFTTPIDTDLLTSPDLVLIVFGQKLSFPCLLELVGGIIFVRSPPYLIWTSPVSMPFGVYDYTHVLWFLFEFALTFLNSCLSPSTNFKRQWKSLHRHMIKNWNDTEKD